MPRPRNKKHPLDRSNIFQQLFATWISRFLKDKGNSPWDQSMHYSLPKKDLPSTNIEKLSKNFYEGKNSLTASIVKTYKWQLSLVLALLTIFLIITFSTVFILKLAADMVTKLPGEELKQPENFRILFGYFVFLCLGANVGEIIHRNNVFFVFRISNWIKSSLIQMIFIKMTKVNSINPSKHSAGKILNYLQIDVNKLELGAIYAVGATYYLMNIVISLAFIIVLLREAVIVMIAILFLCIFISSFVYKWYTNVVNKLLERKDARMNFLKNVIKNISYVKMRAYEIFFQYKICNLRNLEVQFLRKKLVISMFINFFNWITPNLSVLAVLVSYMLFNIKNFSYGGISAFLRIFALFQKSVVGLPSFMNATFDLLISLSRIDEFLRAEEANYEHIKLLEGIERENALEIIDGDFYWSLPYIEKKKKAKRKTKKKFTSYKKEKKFKSSNHKNFNERVAPLLDDTNQVESGLEAIEYNQTPMTIKTELTLKNSRDVTFLSRRSSNTIFSFRLKAINLKIKEGALVFIIGKIGSGKSSLLYSILGEMEKLKESQSKVLRSDNMAFLSQSPWILSQSIKENIILDKELDQDRMAQALLASQFEEDLSQMEHGIETLVGEDGTSLSGGQRTRLVLTRCFYQK